MSDKADSLLLEVRGTFALARNMLDRLPDGRMKSLAITSLEEAFSRAIMSAAEIADPIRGTVKR